MSTRTIGVVLNGVTGRAKGRGAAKVAFATPHRAAPRLTPARRPTNQQEEATSEA